MCPDSACNITGTLFRAAITQMLRGCVDPAPTTSNERVCAGKEPGTLQRYREAELIHCRWAMLGAAGCLAVEVRVHISPLGVWVHAATRVTRLNCLSSRTLASPRSCVLGKSRGPPMEFHSSYKSNQNRRCLRQHNTHTIHPATTFIFGVVALYRLSHHCVQSTTHKLA